MIKLMIADDEHIVIESIKFIVEKFVDGIEVVGSAKSGREAIEKALILKPDIVFMDIHMPGINGMEAIRHIKDFNKEAIFVIISAYEYFQYAKEAVNLGVHEYLLKPINKNKVIETLKNLTQVIEGKRRAMEREMELMEKLNRILPHLEGQFLYSQLFNSSSKDVMFYENVLGLNLQQGYIMVVSIDSTVAEGKEENIKRSLEKQQLYEILRMELKNHCTSLVAPPLLDRIVAFISSNEESEEYETRNRGIDYAKKVSKAIDKKITLDYRIGLGRSYDIELLSESYNEAYVAATYPSEEKIIHYKDIDWTTPFVDSYPQKREKYLLHNLQMGDMNGTVEAFEEIFLWLTTNGRGDKNYIKSKLIELFILTQRILPNYSDEGKDYYNSYLHLILEIEDLQELKLAYINYLKNTVRRLDEYRKRELRGLIAKAIKYIDDHYKQNISLDDVAKEINMSYHYFSKFFKDSTGKNFVDYLTELRIEKSKQILRDSSINIKEVCFEVGYNDPNYFSKIFKKITGITPTDYRNHALPQEVI
ncbi:response regulator transcription factor [Alkaliphilus serpentinus]|uniref:Stage 0 sporulation protein A homolog n=1 Tax=Alkaliphilus serpentinus TaxID=1482731 RepID=A0A833M8I8_9FIRM|nr:response regulator [Alkaliphilus serpentinus]KAB3531117.1 response regulator [Alkaliphilus serpentinus]